MDPIRYTPGANGRNLRGYASRGALYASRGGHSTGGCDYRQVGILADHAPPGAESTTEEIDADTASRMFQAPLGHAVFHLSTVYGLIFRLFFVAF